jgi:hypothetical protein
VSHFARCPELRISHELSLVATFARGPTIVEEAHPHLDIFTFMFT